MKIRTLPILLGLALLACPPAAPPDFRALAEKAYPDNGATPDRHAMDALWTALFKQPQWYFLMTAESAKLKQPVVETVDGEPWLMVFTDLQMLRLYAVANKNVVPDGGAPNTVGTPAAPATDAGPAAAPAAAPAPATDGGPQFVFAVAPPPPNPYLGADGSPLFLSMNAEQTAAFLAGYAGAPVSGIRFNEGSRKGWFASVKSVGNIRSYLKANGKL